MKECVIIGQTNAGKTAFALSFAEYSGADKIDVTFNYPDGFSVRQTYALSIARQELVGPTPHKTRCLQTLKVNVPQGKGLRSIELVDTSGLTEGVHENGEVRRAIAQTLQKLRGADLILHIIDAAQLGRQDKYQHSLPEVDRQIFAYASIRGRYVIIANKMDQSTALLGLSRLQAYCPGQHILPVSALAKTGFREVRAHVGRYL